MKSSTFKPGVYAVEVYQLSMRIVSAHEQKLDTVTKAQPKPVFY